MYVRPGLLLLLSPCERIILHLIFCRWLAAFDHVPVITLYLFFSLFPSDCSLKDPRTPVCVHMTEGPVSCSGIPSKGRVKQQLCRCCSGSATTWNVRWCCLWISPILYSNTFSWKLLPIKRTAGTTCLAVLMLLPAVCCCAKRAV